MSVRLAPSILSADFASLGAAVQTRMLRHAADLVAPGGRLVYATCSSEPEENQDVVESWLRDDSRFRRTSRASVVGEGIPVDLLNDQGQLQTRPDLHGLEAFFAAAADRVGAR